MVETNIAQNDNIQENDNEPDGIIINGNEVINDINIIESKEVQTDNNEPPNNKNITETEKEKDEKNNRIDNNENNSIQIEIKVNNEINNNNLNEKKEETASNPEKKEEEININEKDKAEIAEIKNEIEKKEEKRQIPKIIDESEEFSPLEIILRERQNKNNILNNNQIYFTEANTLISRDQEEMKDIHKSNSNKLYTLTAIPEYSNINIKKTAATPMKVKSLSQKSKNNNNLCLNNLSPEIYMKKKFRINKENDINILKNRIKQIEDEIQKQNDYDYQRAMKECKLKFIKDMKNKEKEKQIIEEHKKLEEKLKNMEEYRKNLINDKIKKILQRQNLKNKKNSEKNNDNNLTEILTIKDKMDKINDEKIFKTLDSYEEKLPILPGMPKYEILKMIKNKEEKDFCINTEKRLKKVEKNHNKNYLKHLHIINDKLAKQSELFNLRSEKCLNTLNEKSEELEENFIAKEMIRRYNIKQNLLRDLSEKKEKVIVNLFKNIENVKEKKELLIKQEQQKIKKILKKLNRQQSIEIKKNLLNSNNENIMNQRNYFANKQKENLDKENQFKKDYYNDLILRQEDYFWIVNDLQKDEIKSRSKAHKNILETQNKKDNEMKSLNKFLEKMAGDNINNQKKGTKMKLFLKQRRMEIENKKREEEEALENHQSF